MSLGGFDQRSPGGFGALANTGRLMGAGQGKVSYLQLIQNDPDLLALWRMDEAAGNFLDVEGGHTATIAGGVTLGTSISYIQGYTGKGATFNGSTGYASVGDIAALDITKTTPFTLQAIVVPNVTRSGAALQYVIYSKARSDSVFNGLVVGLRWQNTAGTAGTVTLVQPFVSFGGGTTGTNTIYKSVYQDVPNGTPFLMTITYDGTGLGTGMNIYINGNLIPSFDPGGVASGNNGGTASQSIPDGTTLTTGQPVEIGRWGALSRFFKGDLQMLAVFGVCKSAAWVRQVATAADPAKPYPLVSATSVYQKSSPRPQVLWDKDFESDSGDCGSAVVMFNLEHQGRIDIKAIAITSANVKAIGAFYAGQSWYGRTAIPIGYNTANAPGSSTSNNSWVDTVLTNCGIPGKTATSDFTTAVAVFRQAMVDAADHSLDWMVEGDLGTVQAVLQSAGDGISALTGPQLVALKVKSLWAIAGNWPFGPSVSDFGATAARAACSAYVLANWPTSVPIILDSISNGDTYVYGENVMVAMPSGNPFRVGWVTDHFGADPAGTKGAWEPTTILSLTDGIDTWCKIEPGFGTASVNSTTGVTSFSLASNSNHNCLRKVQSDAALKAAYNALIKDPSVW
jgi:hypothetical protein